MKRDLDEEGENNATDNTQSFLQQLPPPYPDSPSAAAAVGGGAANLKKRRLGDHCVTPSSPFAEQQVAGAEAGGRGLPSSSSPSSSSSSSSAGSRAPLADLSLPQLTVADAAARNTTLARDALAAWEKALELPDGVADASFRLLQPVVVAASSNANNNNLALRVMHEWAAAAIWTSLRLARIDHGYSRFQIMAFLAPGLLKSGVGAGGGGGGAAAETMKITTLSPLMRTIRDFITTLNHIDTQKNLIDESHARQLFADICIAQTSYQTLVDQYEMYTQVYHALISQPPAEVGQATDDDHIHRYGWMFFLLGADEFFSKDTDSHKAWQNDHIKTWCLYTVLFVGLQLPAHRRRDVRDVYWMLCRTAVPETGDWILHFKPLCSLLCQRYERDPAQFAQFETFSIDTLIENLRANKAQPWFQFTDTPVMISPDCPWRLYQGSLELLLYSNTEDLRRKLERVFDEKYEFDPLLLRHVARPIATPRRFCRTPGTSVRKTTASRSLRLDLEKACVYSHAMTATPLMARSGTHNGGGGPRTAPEFAVHQKLFEERLSTTFVEPAWLLTSELFSDLPPQVASLIIDHANGICDRFLTKLCANYPQFRERQSLGTRLFYCLIYHVTVRSPIRHTPAYARLLKDKHFVRSMVFIAFEIIRHTWQLGNNATTGDLIRYLSPSFTTLAMMLDIVSSTTIWFSDWIKKPIVELQERTLESQIWSEPAFYRMLGIAAAGASGGAELPGGAAEFEGNDNDNDDDDDNYNDDRDGWTTAGVQLRNQISKMINGRLAQLCTDLPPPHNSTQQPPQLYDRAECFVLTVLQHEHQNHLISNRHVDLLLICCLYAAAIVERQPMTFKVIMEGYRKQPQFVVKTLTQVYMGPNQKTDLTVFYNKVFLPTMRKHITSSTETPQRVPLPHQQHRPPPSSFLSRPLPPPPPPANTTSNIPPASTSSSLSIPPPPPPPHAHPHMMIVPGQMTPRTRRLVALDTPLTPRTMSPGSSPSAASRRLFSSAGGGGGGGAGGGVGLPPRMPTLRK
ncbi:Retinoblastoma- protein 1 [Geranomyces variabilis]|nr:Retinoblastoma- protein 1 [Geranomyces variabilis]